jgi:O-antigen/teichoic acid export membrane protein
MVNRLKEHAYNLRQNQGFKRYLFNTLWMFSDQVIRLLAAVVVGIWVARYLGPGQFGVLNYAVAFVAIFGVISKLGMDSIMVRDLVNDPLNSQKLLGTAYWLKILGALAAFVMIGGYALFSAETGDTKAYLLILAMGLFFQAFEVIDFFFQAKVLSKFVSICKTIQLLISSAAKVYLVYAGADLIWFIAVQLLDQVTLGITQAIAFRIHTGNLQFLRYFSWASARTLIRESWPLIFGSIVVMIYMKVDQIMIMNILGEHEMGLFSAAVRISEAWYFVPVVITNSLFPAIINAKKTDEQQYRKRLQRLFNFMVMISLAVAIGVTLVSTWVMTLLFGEAYRAAGPILSIHVWAGIFVSLGVASSGWFLSENLQRFALVKAIIGMCLNIGLNFILIPRYGAIGSAVATIISQMSGAVVLNALHSKSMEVLKMQLQALFFFWNYNFKSR